jgi:hypothetical protein
MSLAKVGHARASGGQLQDCFSSSPGCRRLQRKYYSFGSDTSEIDVFDWTTTEGDVEGIFASLPLNFGQHDTAVQHVSPRGGPTSAATMPSFIPDRGNALLVTC